MENAHSPAPPGRDDDPIADLASVAVIDFAFERLPVSADAWRRLAARLLAHEQVATHHTGLGLVAAPPAMEDVVTPIAAALAITGQTLQLLPTATAVFDALEIAIDAILGGRWTAGLVLLGDQPELALAVLLRPRTFGLTRLARAQPGAGSATSSSAVEQLHRWLSLDASEGLVAASSTRALRLTRLPPPPEGHPDLKALLALQREIDRAHEVFLTDVWATHRQWLDDAEALLTRLEGARALPRVEPGLMSPRVAEPTAAGPPAARGRTVRTWTYERIVRQRVAAPSIGFTFGHLQPGVIATVLNDGDPELASALLEALEALGVRASVGDEVHPRADLVISLHGMLRGQDLGGALETIERAQAAIGPLEQHFAGRRGVLVVVYDTGGAFGHDGAPGPDAALAGLSAIARTFADAAPTVDVKSIDLERGARSCRALAHLIADELFAGGPEVEVGLRAHGARSTLVPLPVRFVPRDRPMAPPARPLVLVDGDPAAETLLRELARPTNAIVLATTAPMRDEPLPLQQLTDREELANAIVARTTASPVGETDALRRADDILASRGMRQLVRSLKQVHGITVEVLPIDVERPSLTAARLRTRFEDVGLIACVRVDRRDARPDPDAFGRHARAWDTLLQQSAESPALDTIAVVSLHASEVPDRVLAEDVLGAIAVAHARRRHGITPRVVRAALTGDTLAAPLPEHLANELLLGPEEDLDVAYTAPDTTPDRHSLAPRTAASVLIEPRRDAFIREVPPGECLPISLVLEWFVRLAYAACPDMRFASLDHLERRHTPELTPWPHATTRLTIDALVTRQREDATVQLELRDTTGVTCFAAIASMTRLPEPPFDIIPIIDPDALDDTLFRPDTWYPQHLLGPHFQPLRRIESLPDDKLVATLELSRHARWPGSWWTDPALLEGALQLACWHAESRDGGNHRPYGFDRYERSGPAPASGHINAILDHTPDRQTRITLTDEHGAPIATFHGVLTRRTPEP